MFLVRSYYRLKPIMPRGIRLAFRRWRANRRKRVFAHEWPVLPAASARPQGWQGWPGGKQFALLLTHDVEGPDGLARCRALAELEMQHGFRSSFNFIPEGDYRVPAELRRYLSDQQFEVGVHDLKHDGKLYWSREGFRRHAEQINHYLLEWNAVGFRSGFMHHNLEWLHDLNVLYDSSTFDTDPFEPQPDGVNTIFPFWVPLPNSKPHTRNSKLEGCSAAEPSTFNPQPSTFNGAGNGYMELPYTLAQDITLFLVLMEPTIDIWKQKLDWVAQHGGMAMVNVHPDYMDMTGNGRSGFSYPSRFYAEFLEYVRDRYAGRFWSALPREVAAHAKAVLHSEAVTA